MDPVEQKMVKRFIRQRGVTRCPTHYCEGALNPDRVYGNETQTRSGAWSTEPNTRFSQMERLAIARIAAALELLTKRCWTHYDRAEKEKAVAWLTSPTSDVVDWCEEAGICPRRLRRVAQEIIETGMLYAGARKALLEIKRRR